MTTSSDPASPPPATGNSHYDLVDMRPTRFELTSGFFLTLILFLGVIVSGMFLLWTLHRWASQSEIRHTPATQTTFVEAGDLGSENDFAVPSAWEVRKLTEPSVKESLGAVTAAVEDAAESLEQFSEPSQRNAKTGHAGREPLRGLPDAEAITIP